MPIHNAFYLVQGTLNPTALEKTGPILQVEISVPPALAEFLAKNQKPVPPPMVGKALVDTGASITAVELEVFTSLGISPISFRKVLTPSGQAQQNTFPVQIAFPGTPLPQMRFNEVLGSELKAQGFIALIGRDVLRHFILIYNGPGANFSLSF